MLQEFHQELILSGFLQRVRVIRELLKLYNNRIQPAIYVQSGETVHIVLSLLYFK